MCFSLKFLLCLSLFILSKCQDIQKCQTPNGNAGKCIPARQCQPMRELLVKLERPPFQIVRKKLNNYICSFDNKTAHVCCPEGPIDEAIFEQNDVSNHTNLRLLPAECGYFPIGNSKIFIDLDDDKFPWMALLSYKTKEGPVFKCGGTIINDRYILTVAHCLQNMTTPLLGVRVGANDNIKTKQNCTQLKNGTISCTAGYQDLPIEEIIPHPLFNLTTKSDDIGLIRVSKINLNFDNARPVCLPTEDLKNEKIGNVIVADWKLPRSNPAGPITLQKFHLKVVDQDECKYKFKNISGLHLTSKQLCAGGTNRFCPESGGASLHQTVLDNGVPRFIQQGTLSFGAIQCIGYPDVYSRVAHYMDWILDTIRP